jgi:hypothetical protein
MKFTIVDERLRSRNELESTARGVTGMRRYLWERDGLAGEEINWSAGYGPKTAAWILKAAEATQPLPGVIAAVQNTRKVIQKSA